MSKLKTLHIEFENLEWCKIPDSMIQNLSIKHIHKIGQINYNDFNSELNYAKAYIANVIRLELDLSMIKQAKLKTNFNEPVAKRLTESNDIISITLTNDKNQSYSYMTTWEDDPDVKDSNANQHYFISRHDPKDLESMTQAEIDDLKQIPHYMNDILYINIYKD